MSLLTRDTIQCGRNKGGRAKGKSTGKRAAGGGNEAAKKPELPADVEQFDLGDGFRGYEFQTKSELDISMTFSAATASPGSNANVLFSVGGDLARGNVTDNREARAIVLKLRRIMDYDVSTRKPGFIYSTSAYIGDGGGAQRAKAYEAIGFSKAARPGDTQYAIVGKDGKLSPYTPGE